MIKVFSIIILGLVIYSNVLNGEFVVDDYSSIVQNPAIIHNYSLKNIWGNFNTRFVGGLSFALNFHFGQLNVFGYHLVNIFIHIINTFLVYIFILLTFQTPSMREDQLHKYSSRIAFFSALIFLTHPIQTQAVSYICQRYTSIAVGFYLAALIFYIKARLQNTSVYYAAALLMMLLSLFTKPMSWTIPFSILIYELYFLKGSKKRLLVTFLITTLVVAIVLRLAQINVDANMIQANPSAASYWNYFFTEINVLRTYLRLLVFPFGQSHSYDYPLANGFWQWPTVCSTIFLLGLMATAFYLREKQRLLSFSIVWYFHTIAAYVVFVVLYGSIGADVMYDHWLYLPMVGFSIFLVVILCRLFNDPRKVKQIMIALIIILSLLSYQRNKVWQTEIGLWEDVVSKYPNKLVHHYWAAIAYKRQHLWDQALLSYQKALECYQKQPSRERKAIDSIYASQIYPQLVEVYNNRGLFYYEQKQYDLALTDFNKALQLDSRSAIAYLNRGNVHFQKKDYPAALKDFDKAIEFDPTYHKAYLNRAVTEGFINETKNTDPR